MNVLRFTGNNNRSALDQVRAQLGPDALILSSRRTPAGVEICAAASLPDFSDAPAAQSQGGHNEIQLAQLKRELSSLRETLQSALGDRKWQDTAGARPVAATVAQRLHTLGIGRALAGELSDSIAPNASLDDAWRDTLATLTQRVGALSDAEIAGCRIKILIGASGVGKTRAAVGLLGEALRRHGSDYVAVINCNDPRVETPITRAALAGNTKILTARNRQELAAAIEQCRWAREIIVDTPGLNPSRGSQDPVVALLARQRAGSAAFLVLPATGHSDHLRELADHALALPVLGAIITKVDEAVTLGGVLDVMASFALPVAGRIDPATQSLVPVNGRELLANAKRMAKRALERRASQLKVAV